MNIKKILSTGLLMYACISGVQAQQASCEIMVALTSPNSTYVIHPYEIYHIKVSIRNNGPDGLAIGDTLYYNTPLMSASATAPYVLTQDIPAGGNASLTLTSEVNEHTEDVTMDYCVKLISKPTNDGSFIDPNLNNNTSCQSVSFMGIGPTSVMGPSQGRNSLRLYPNPAKGNEIRLAISTTISGTTTVVIRDIAGRELSRKLFEQPAPGMESLQLDITKLLPGMYFVEVLQKNGRFSGRFVRQ